VKLSNYSFGCHGIPRRCFVIKGKPMPFCARCLGTSVGHIGSLLGYLLFTLPSIPIAVSGLLVMYADWLVQNKLTIYHSNLMRLCTGILGGFGMGSLIWKAVSWII